MQAVWDVFDMEKTDKVLIKDLRVIMRALDIDLNPEELEIVKKQIDPEEEGFIRFANLKAVLEEKLKEQDTFEDLIEQFKLLDKDKDGRIANPEFKQFMQNMGSRMTADEIEEMMKEADPRNEGTIEIEDFC